LEKYDNEQANNEHNDSMAEFRATAKFSSGPVPAPNKSARPEIQMPEEKPMGCMEKLGKAMGMTSGIDPKKIYQIELKIRNLENDLESEREQRS